MLELNAAGALKRYVQVTEERQAGHLSAVTVVICDAPAGLVGEKTCRRQRWCEKHVATIDDRRIGPGCTKASAEVLHPFSLFYGCQPQELARRLICATKLRQRV